MAAIRLGERSRQIATRLSGPTPSRRRRWASRFLRVHNQRSPIGEGFASSGMATAPGWRAAVASNSWWTRTSDGSIATPSPAASSSPCSAASARQVRRAAAASLAMRLRAGFARREQQTRRGRGVEELGGVLQAGERTGRLGIDGQRVTTNDAGCARPTRTRRSSRRAPATASARSSIASPRRSGSTPGGSRGRSTTTARTIGSACAPSPPWPRGEPRHHRRPRRHRGRRAAPAGGTGARRRGDLRLVSRGVRAAPAPAVPGAQAYPDTCSRSGGGEPAAVAARLDQVWRLLQGDDFRAATGRRCPARAGAGLGGGAHGAGLRRAGEPAPDVAQRAFDGALATRPSFAPAALAGRGHAPLAQQKDAEQDDESSSSSSAMAACSAPARRSGSATCAASGSSTARRSRYQPQNHQGAGFRSVTEKPFTGINHDYIRDDSHAFILRELSRCIDCGRCANVCAEVVGAACYDFMRIGFDTLVTTRST